MAAKRDPAGSTTARVALLKPEESGSNTDAWKNSQVKPATVCKKAHERLREQEVKDLLVSQRLKLNSLSCNA